jgi:DNA repair exonuclease SbcCD ATPase subunit
MATLEDAATDLVDRLKALEGRSDEAEKAFADLEARISHVSDQLESDSDALTERVRTFIQHVHDAKNRLDQEGQEAGAALKALDDAAESARSEQQGEVQEARGEIQALQQHVEAVEGQVGTMLQHVLEAAGGLKAQADETENNLEQALAEARKLLEEGLTPDLERLQDEIKQQVDELHSTINDKCTGELQDAYDDFAAKLDEVETTLEAEAFGKAPDHARETVEAAFKECADAYREELDEIVASAAKLEAAIHELEQEVDEVKSDAVGGGKDDLLEKMTDTDDGLGQMQQALSEVKALLGRFSFVRM